MKIVEWQQIEKDFIEWDNTGHSNASQRQILNWFKKRLKEVNIKEVRCMSCEKEVNYSEGIFTCADCSK
jgi:hypothetical protein